MEMLCSSFKPRYMIIVAGGKGIRMNNDIPKQFLPLSGKPILMRTIEKVKDADQNINIVLVISKEHQDYWLLLCREYDFVIEHKIVEGGNERFFSVKNGLALIQEESIIGIHDGVRPFVSSRVINECFQKAQEKTNAIPGMKPIESVRIIDKDSNISMNRNNIVLVQTPQCFESAILKKAYSQPFNPLFTDDASVVESIGEKINLIEGNIENIKITNQLDITYAENLINGKIYN